MSEYKRVFAIVLDSLGIGAMPDSRRFGDVGVDTFGHILERMGTLDIPNLQKLGFLNLHCGGGMSGAERPLGRYMRMAEASNAKDTMAGHWEMMGIRTESPFHTFTDTGFPPELIAELEKRCGRRVIGNKSASGTAILEELAEEEIETGAMIVYTSADSVFQIAAHEEVVPLEQLYEYCRMAREILRGEHGVGRVIARPFTGPCGGSFTRTPHRHDFSILPPAATMLDQLSEAGKDVIAVGKIKDIFAGKGITESVYTAGNAEGIDRTLEYLDKDFQGLCFINLVDYDMLYGHRRDVEGYAKALSVFDDKLPELLGKMREGDILMITADHGCDPGYLATNRPHQGVYAFSDVRPESKAGKSGNQEHLRGHSRHGFALFWYCAGV